MTKSFMCPMTGRSFSSSSALYFSTVPGCSFWGAYSRNQRSLNSLRVIFLAALCTQIPVAFNGNDIFVFSMDNEANIIGENEAASGGEVTVAPVKIRF